MELEPAGLDHASLPTTPPPPQEKKNEFSAIYEIKHCISCFVWINLNVVVVVNGFLGENLLCTRVWKKI